MAGFEMRKVSAHCWRVRRWDGLVEGIFTDRLTALRFLRRESVRYRR